jgi:hypothetical protein
LEPKSCHRINNGKSHSIFGKKFRHLFNKRHKG